MDNSFEYLDIIILALIAGFIILRLRTILGRRTGHEKKFFNTPSSKRATQKNTERKVVNLSSSKLDDAAKEKFIEGAKAAYETIITSFAKGDKKSLKGLLGKNMYNRFSDAIDERKNKQLKSETTFIGLKSTKILKYKKKENIYNITVNFVSEVITCIKDINNQVLQGNPDIIKTVNDVWSFSKNMWSHDPTWYLTDTSSK